MLTRPVALHFAKTGVNQNVATIPWLSSDFSDVVSVSKLGVGFGPYSQPWFDSFGNTFSLGISSGTLAFGNCTTWLGFQTGLTQSGAGTTRTITTSGAVTPKTPTDVGNFVYDITLTLDTDRLKLIKAQNSTTSLAISLLDPKYSNLQADPDAYSVAPANADVLTFIRPFEFGVMPTANATTGMVSGIALGTTADKDPFFRQVGGLAMVNATNGGAALAVNGPAIPSGGVAGSVTGSAAVAANQVGVSTAVYGVVGKSLPIWLTLLHT